MEQSVKQKYKRNRNYYRVIIFVFHCVLNASTDK